MDDFPKNNDALFLDGHSDRRTKSRRFAASNFVAGAITGKLVDVSESGLGLEAQQALPVLKQGTFTLDIGKARPQFRGEVRWCRLISTTASETGETIPVYRAGVSLFHS